MIDFRRTLLALAALPMSVLAQYAPSGPSAVQIYGRLDASVDAVHISGVGTRRTLSTDTSYVGFRGSEDLGSGLVAFFKLESQLDISTGIAGGSLNLGNGATPPASTVAPQFFNREALVGLRSNDLGQLDFGAHWAPGVWLSSRVDPFVRGQMGAQYTLLQGTAVRGYSIQFVNSVQYATPMVNGFVGRVLVQAPEGTFNKNYGGLLDYFGERLYVGVQFDSAQANLAAAALGVSPSTRSNTLGIGATYRFDAVKLSGYVQQNRISQLSNVVGYDVGAAVPIGLGELRLAVSHTNNRDRAASLFAVGYNYFLSKRTQLYATASKLDNSAGSRFALWPTLQDGVVPTAGGQDLTGVQFGIRHIF